MTEHIIQLPFDPFLIICHPTSAITGGQGLRPHVNGNYANNLIKVSNVITLPIWCMALLCADYAIAFASWVKTLFILIFWLHECPDYCENISLTPDIICEAHYQVASMPQTDTWTLPVEFFVVTFDTPDRKASSPSKDSFFRVRGCFHCRRPWSVINNTPCRRIWGFR